MPEYYCSRGLAPKNPRLTPAQQLSRNHISRRIRDRCIREGDVYLHSHGGIAFRIYGSPCGDSLRIHGIWSHDADWLRLISSFSQQVVRDCGERGSK
ncbi:hypothetical protein F5B19DRAFT_465030 [Rostrohypoxylon terebratum]|nr:hypothetical protein F5B19DRAFT_465030 [Rostrohypoxylon terebratum]